MVTLPLLEPTYTVSQLCGEVQDVLRGIEGIRFVYFTEQDVVRHELVQQIIRAYETFQPRAERRGEGHGGGMPSDGTGT